MVAAYKFRVSKPGQTDINAATRCCAVYGFPIRHSASPAMHNAAFAKLGLNWRYLAFEVHPANLRTAIAGAIFDNTDENLRKWISNAPGRKPGSLMPNLGLNPEQVKALAAYLRTLQ